MSTAIRATVVFTGRVQGVGFRWTARRIGERFEVTGWVRNEPDGSVQCVIEGEGKEVDRFINAVREAMSDNIRQIRTDQSGATGEFSGFEIRR